MRLTIDGTDITPYIANQGIKWQRSDVDSPDAGRTLDGKLHRARVATKIRLDITCRPLMSFEARIVLNAIQAEWVTVSYDDPMLGYRENIKMYANNNPATYLMKTTGGTEWWKGITFPLIEQ